MAFRRAHADEYALRVNRAVVLLGRRSPADAVRALQAEYGLSERQARRYVSAALDRPEGGVVALYGRVSSERQRQEQPIASQTAALRELAEQRGLLVPEEMVFEDDGISGASLQRPALERLRDRAFEGCFDVLLCHAPDRLA